MPVFYSQLDQMQMCSAKPASSAKIRPAKIAYLMSRFPKISETFILFEILEMERLGFEVEVYPLLRERQPVAHPEAMRMTGRAHFLPFLSRRIVSANLQLFRRHPSRYLRTLFGLLRGAWKNKNFFVGVLAYWPKAVAFARSMQEHGIKHMHAHFCNHPAMVALAIHRLTGIPFSFTAHGSDLHKDRTLLDQKVAAAAFAVTVSEFNRDVMFSACDEKLHEKIHVIRCGIDPEVFSPAQKNGRPGALRIVCVASYEEVKGHKYLVEACGRLRDRGIDFICDLIGEGPLRPEVTHQITRMGLQDKIIMHGSKPRLEVARMMTAAHVKVLASVPTREGKREGVPVVLMEAMACGLPVISSRLSGIPELVEDGRTGILLPPGDSEALALALQKLVADPELRFKMGRAGREKVLREYNLRLSVKQLAQSILSNCFDPLQG
jgi:glycosyltransferase involved in cell wall biosynthesis